MWWPHEYLCQRIFWYQMTSYHTYCMVFGHTHTPWSPSVFVSSVTQHVLTWVSGDSRLEASVIHNMTALDEPWLDLKWSSWDVGRVVPQPFFSLQMKQWCEWSPEMRKHSPSLFFCLFFSVQCKFMLMPFLSSYTNN